MKQLWLHPGGSLPGVEAGRSTGGQLLSAPSPSTRTPIIPAQGSPSESLDLCPGAPGFDWCVPPWQPRGHPACPSGRLPLTLGLAGVSLWEVAPTLGLAGVSLCHIQCHDLFHSHLPRGAPSFPSRSVCPCLPPRAPFIVHLAQSGYRVGTEAPLVEQQ